MEQFLQTETIIDEEMETAQRKVLRAQRSALLGLRQEGVISQEVFDQPGSELDAELLGKRSGEALEEE